MTKEKEPQNEKKRTQEPLIIGIGASAGGVEALQQFFSCMPNHSGLSFVVVQHLSPNYKSLMADILGKHTEMAVIQAANEMQVEADTVYLIPPKKFMTIQDGKLILADYAAGSLNHPIDMFFTSLAKEKREHAIVAVLSGTGSDGTNGVKAVKEYGGLVIAQDPDTAKFDGMPKSVIQTGLADFILSPEEAADEILNFSQTPLLLRTPRIDGPADEEAIFSEEETLSHIYIILKNASGIDFTYYKRSTILRRIERRMLVTHTATLAEFARLLGNNNDEVNILIKEILIGVTNFFRDAPFFEKLKYNAIYKIIERTREDEPIRVWSVGCSTGEEAYSIAILFQEALEELQVKRDIKIFATDVDSRAIEQASKGIYSENIIDDITPDRLSRFFIKQNDQYHISKQIRRMIVFAPHNMFSDPPFGKLDMISCRNVMIYFQPVLRRGLFAIFHSALKNNGYLFLGKSETASEYANLFKPICGPEKIYLHKGEGKVEDLTPPTFNIPNIQAISMRSSYSMGSPQEDRNKEIAYTKFLEAFLPASVVLDENDCVVHFFGNYADYFTLAPGKATLNFFSMLNKDLTLVASTALSRCHVEKIPVTYTDIAVDCPSGRKIIDLMVQPIPAAPGEESTLTAVLFLERRHPETEGITEKYEIDATAARRIADLEREFQVSQRDLRATIQRLETVNGELQAANEELLTANEELQSSTEELQSVNEELYTVNTEHQLKLDELTMMTNDLSNFLSSTMIGILFVDSKLNIRKFTEYVGREFQLMEHDIGRPIQIFAHSFPDEEIERDANTVLKDLVSIDREVTALNGRCYTLRIAPYRTTENSIRGLVITIIDSLGTAPKNK
ncbi:PAS domain-containing protein [Anaerotignum lactatifermentans]|uniref:PAS domain-containing protein n=1 Tax=Anaerotignum lactatifermentans TaxID=160404 RepID=A0ABS2G8G9_9FIRM|nr:CheR family methyltransferase [Anaerotignum lactatifermentans]MBM6829298.1 PAS domain-containing protein [Anaerotignum lactatifermentans]MBM6877462.1 PAS domain-containing protein [Anaerotignum lactatifermentans]MBM6950875.1 PAS domain-containing protein [Anaerotignum lactatifermentans]